MKKQKRSRKRQPVAVTHSPELTLIDWLDAEVHHLVRATAALLAVPALLAGQITPDEFRKIYPG